MKEEEEEEEEEEQEEGLFRADAVNKEEEVVVYALRGVRGRM